MEYLVSCVAFALLFLAHIIPSDAADSIQPSYDFDTYKIFEIRKELVLSCNVSTSDPKQASLEWLKDDKPVEDEASLKSRYIIKPDENKFIIEKTIDSDAGTYVCRLSNSPDIKGEINVVAKPSSKIPPNTSVIEGETLKISCQAFGNPKPVIEWTIGNETYKESRGRVTLSDDNGIENSLLTMTDITLDDRGTFVCKAVNVASQYINTTDGSTYVRVKDKLAALWPFLGICIEVFVLCAIILIYEKRRNKPDLEESDTDQSPDQKKQ